MEKGQYTYDYPRPAVTTDCVVFGFDGHDLKILLIERGIEPYKGAWAFPGGFLNMDETAEQGALRELREETGLDLNYLKQVGAFSDVDRDPRTRVITIAFYALAKKSEVQGGDDAAKAQWFALNEVPRLAFDHDYILRKTMEKLRKDTTNIMAWMHQPAMLEVFPNPTDGLVTVRFTAEPNSHPMVALFDTKGRKLLSREISSDETQLDLSGLAKGLYLLRVTDGKNVSAIGKVIVQ